MNVIRFDPSITDDYPKDAPRLANPDDVFKKFQGNWYNVSTDYWSKQNPNVNGMLGGYEWLSGIDVLNTEDIIKKYQNIPQKTKLPKMGHQIIADCGAGIGRVSQHVFSSYFDSIDLIDPIASFLEVATQNLKSSNIPIRTIVSGIQDWTPDCDYDAFWIQWAIMYLTDEDAISFLKRCKAHLKPNGYIFVKDNIGTKNLKEKKENATFYEEDRGICRTYVHYIELFKNAGLKLIESQKQTGWDQGLLPLYTFVLK
ncbi:Alpha N-terminal protein methyltransferase 1 [Histomonas meleagridis]|uniref:Alpha N-terminal protein methyltransferase 1 n=1 Tax=Histomonas meleagridis TaxID=135588 RepID=UPI003559C87C|nr:Alpha N-terminal protein methyltransferase 1 [Histomonas meleagridis]KAH0804279.1 Alpha N-terminal protein methyltransferase 1 [Histomonas meleagridis]